MEYLAHIAGDGREQSVLEHLTGTARLAAGFASAFGAGEQGELAGLAHDIGKYSQGFQKRLHGGNRVDHATAGGVECAKQNQLFAALAVMGHHGGLPDVGSRSDGPGGSTFFARLNRTMAGLLEPYGGWAEEVSLPPAALPAYCNQDGLTDAFFTRMLYSCLVDADFLDTEAFMEGKFRETPSTADMDGLLRRLNAYIAGWFPPKGELNRRRCAILERCMEEGRTRKPGLFTLTVPTGGGKTVASLAFALEHARANGLRRVIYVIPYTSIIEQTADEFRRILGAENVLEHHSGVTYDVDERGELSPENQALLYAAENWDMPVVVTTAVQFFESLYASRPSRCRKLHNIAQSVVIFDEAQMLPVPYLRPCVSAISQLVAHYGVSAVLCTATQPALEPLFREFLPGAEAVELCPAGLAAASVFRRVTFQMAGKLTWEELAARLNAQDQVLCIVNSRRAAAQIYGMLAGEGCFHLSTLMVPAHRRLALEEIRRRLRAGEPCRVVSTSLVEAGVDVDFPAVCREENGLDSVLQAAGRCNREGRRDREDSVVTVFQGQDKPPAIFDIPIGAARETARKYPDLAAPEAIGCYFDTLLRLKGKAAQDKNQILPLLREQRLPFREVDERFHLIESSARTVYIPWGEGRALTERLQRGERSRALFRALGQYGVSVYPNHFAALERAHLLLPLEDGGAVLLDVRQYDEKTGLAIDPRGGWEEFI